MSRYLFQPATSKNQEVQQRYQTLASSELNLILGELRKTKPSSMELSDFRRRLWVIVENFRKAMDEPSWSEKRSDELAIYETALNKCGVYAEIRTKKIVGFKEVGQTEEPVYKVYDDQALYDAVRDFLNKVLTPGKEEKTYRKPFGDHIKAFKDLMDVHKGRVDQLSKVPPELYKRLAELDTLHIQLECKERIRALEMIVAEVEAGINELIENYSEDRALMMSLASAIKQKEDLKVQAGEPENYSNRETQRTLESLIGSMGAHIEATTIETNAKQYDLDVFSRLVKLRDELGANKQAQEYLYEQIAAEQTKTHDVKGGFAEQINTVMSDHKAELERRDEQFNKSKTGWMKMAQGLREEVKRLTDSNQALQEQLFEKDLLLSQQAARIRELEAAMLAKSRETKILMRKVEQLRGGRATSGLPKPDPSGFDTSYDSMSISSSPTSPSTMSMSEGSSEEFVTFDVEELYGQDGEESDSAVSSTPSPERAQLQRGHSDDVSDQRDRVSAGVLIRRKQRTLFPEQHDKQARSVDPHKPKTPPGTPASKLNADGGSGSEESFDGSGLQLLG